MSRKNKVFILGKQVWTKLIITEFGLWILGGPVYFCLCLENFITKILKIVLNSWKQNT